MALSPQDRELLQETHDRVTSLAAYLEECMKKVDRHEQVLFGNGMLGLVTRVRIIWTVAIAIVGIGGLVGAVAAVVAAAK